MSIPQTVLEQIEAEVRAAKVVAHAAVCIIAGLGVAPDLMRSQQLQADAVEQAQRRLSYTYHEICWDTLACEVGEQVENLIARRQRTVAKAARP